jgi:HK97 family phage major capsid protein
MNVNELKAKRAALLDEAKASMEKTQAEKRSWTSEDQAKVEAMMTEAESIGQQIATFEKLAGITDARSARTVVASEERAARPRASAEYRSINERYLRMGYTALDDAEKRTLQIEGSAPNGGYLVAEEFDTMIREQIAEFNPLRAGIGVDIMRTTGDKHFPLESSVGDADLVGESEDIPDDDDPIMDRVTIGAFGLKKIIKVSRELINDNIVQLPAYIARNLGKAFAGAEYKYCIVGDGTGEPKGIRQFAIDHSKVVTTDSSTKFTYSELVETVESIPSQYQNGLVWFMNQTVRAACRVMLDGIGRPVWGDAINSNPATLLGYPVHTCSYMDSAMTAGKYPAVLVNPKHCVLADRGPREVQALFELFAGKGQVGYLGWQRFDFAVLDANAVAVLKLK